MKKLLIVPVIVFALGIAIVAGTKINMEGSASLLSPSGDEKQNGFTSYPAHPNANNPKRFIYEMRPGETIEDALTVENLANLEQDFDLYGVDAVINEKDEFQPLLNSDQKKEIGSWIKFETPEITLAGKTKSENKFTLTVPENTPYGNYLGFIGAEKFGNDKKNAQVKIVSRKVHKVEITVTDNPQPIPTYEEEWNKAYANALKIKATSYSTGAIFIACFGYLAYDFFKKRRKSVAAKAKSPEKK